VGAVFFGAPALGPVPWALRLQYPLLRQHGHGASLGNICGPALWGGGHP